MNEPSLPIEPLIAEHRLTARMIAAMRWRVADMESIRTADIGFIDGAVEFMRTYADRCHHGKEEEILFRELGSRPLSVEHRRVLDELLAEHVFARTTTQRLVEARDRYAAGERSAFDDITACLHMFVEFYPKHVAKEERDFFRPVMSYFTAAELGRMLADESEFDRRFAQDLYGKAVTAWERMPDPGSDPQRGEVL